MTKSKCFDRIAERYDATRGGEERGRRFAADLHPLFTGRGPVLEIGVGTGVVSKGLQELGRAVIGVDIGFEMAKRARERIGARVTVGDAEDLPVLPSSIDDAYSVWVLQLVDVDAVLHEVARILRPRGRYIVLQRQDVEPNPLHDTMEPMQRALRDDTPLEAGPMARRAWAAGLRLTDEILGARHTFTDSPELAASRIESRELSTLWDVSDEVWTDVVAPTIRALRALPSPGVEIVCASRARIQIFERAR